MSMEEQEQWQPSNADETMRQEEYGDYRAESDQNAQEQKVYPQEETRTARRSVLNTLVIVFSGLGYGPSIVGLVGSILVLSHSNGNQNLLSDGLLALVGSGIALLLFVTISILATISEVRRVMRYRRSRCR